MTRYRCDALLHRIKRAAAHLESPINFKGRVDKTEKSLVAE